ncbi:MAG: PAS domain-containing protein [Oscillochloris sp.]|nr:PAS domain-containing protein [Oscillochloris sp.]
MGEQDLLALQAEINRLNTRILELEAVIAARGLSSGNDEADSHFKSILASLQDIVWSQHPETFEVLFVNPAVEQVFGYPPESFLHNSMLWFEAIYPDDRTAVETFLPKVVQEGYAEVEYRVTDSSGHIHWLHDRALLIRDTIGYPLRIDGIATDITARKHAEAEQLLRQQQDETIRIQEALLRELSAPVLPIDQEVLIMPLIGTIDQRRAQYIMEVLLTRVAEDQAELVIIDITGIPMVDAQVANGLMHTAQAVSLLGSQVVFTGIRPEVAQTLVTLGVDLSRMITLSTLERGIAYARQRMTLNFTSSTERMILNLTSNTEP